MGQTLLMIRNDGTSLCRYNALRTWGCNDVRVHLLEQSTIIPTEMETFFWKNEQYAPSIGNYL